MDNLKKPSKFAQQCGLLINIVYQNASSVLGRLDIKLSKWELESTRFQYNECLFVDLVMGSYAKKSNVFVVILFFKDDS